MRKAELARKTAETDIVLTLALDDKGVPEISTPVGFLSHMLELFSRHSGISLKLKVAGDIQVDAHHTVEDTGIVLGKALYDALGDKKGIVRYGSIMMVMDEVRCDVAVDLGGRANLVYNVPRLDLGFSEEENGYPFDFSLIKEFMKAVSDNLKATIHIEHHSYSANENRHHVAEAVFKGFARAIAAAVQIKGEDIPSTKGVLD